MYELIAHDVLKAGIFFLFLLIAVAYIFVNLNNSKKLYFAIVFYIPISFKTLSGSLVVYLIILLYLLDLLTSKGGSRNRTVKEGITDKILLGAILVFTMLSLVNTDNASVFFFDRGRIRLSLEYLDIIVFISSIMIYTMTKKHIQSKDDVYKLFKTIILSASLASIAGYLQIINPENTYIFKYIVIGENLIWANRVAATMQGYEYLAEYTAIVLSMCVIILMRQQTTRKRALYLILLINLIIIMTMTQVRGIYIALALSTIYLISLMLMQGKVGTSLKLLSFSLATIAVLVATVVTIDVIKPGAGFVDRFSKMEIDVKKGEYATRTQVWAWGANTIAGMDLAETLVGAGHKYLKYETITGSQSSWPHSLYLSYIMRDGFLGLGIFLLFILWLYKQSLGAITQSKRLGDKELYLIAIALNFILVLFIIDETKIEFIRHDRSQNITWLIFGIIVAFSHIVKGEYMNAIGKRRQESVTGLIKRRKPGEQTTLRSR